jgi:hypothetical protein
MKRVDLSLRLFDPSPCLLMGQGGEDVMTMTMRGEGAEDMDSPGVASTFVVTIYTH